MNHVFLEILVIVGMGLGALIGSAFLPHGDDTSRNIVTMVATAGSGLVGAAIGRWTERKNAPNGNGKNGNGNGTPHEYLSYEVEYPTPAPPRKDGP